MTAAAATVALASLRKPNGPHHTAGVKARGISLFVLAIADEAVFYSLAERGVVVGV